MISTVLYPQVSSVCCRLAAEDVMTTCCSEAKRQRQRGLQVCTVLRQKEALACKYLLLPARKRENHKRIARRTRSRRILELAAACIREAHEQCRVYDGCVPQKIRDSLRRINTNTSTNLHWYFTNLNWNSQNKRIDLSSRLVTIKVYNYKR